MAPPLKPRRGEMKNVGELLMFGYSCKLFRDDEKALYIDQGKHLIPWMGDETVKIDRYDGRGALYDLKQYEPLPGGFDSMMSLTNEERRIEQMCDEERYYALNKNEDVDLLYQEEELKRLQAASKDKLYGQVGFTYNEDSNGTSDIKEEQGEVEETDKDDVFVLIPQLDMPVNTVLPTSKKHFAIIEKTAAFIHSQGAQMEILLKMKQAGNPHFGFLSFDNALYPFYRHVLSAIQSGRYLPGTYEQTTSAEHNTSSEQEDYLHPSLHPTMSTQPESAPSVPSIAYKPSEDCAYSMLINKIREKQTILPLLGLDSKGSSDTSRSPSSTNTSSRSNSPTPADTDTPSPGQVATKVVVPEPVIISKSAVISGAPEYYNPEDGCSDTEDESVPSVSERDVGPASTMPVEPPPPDITPPVLVPDPALKLIIDKLVLYVAKNGRDFEIVVKRKCDPRFSFLESGDKYNAYYERELGALLYSDTAPRQPVASSKSEAESSQKQSFLRFSIKKPRAEKTISTPDTKVKSALEDSSDEDPENKTSESAPSPPPPPPPIISEGGGSTGASSVSAMDESEAVPPPPCISGNDLTRSRIDRHSVDEKKSGSSSSGQVESDEKKAERKRRAEAFLKMLQRTTGGTVDLTGASQPAQPTSAPPVDEVEHVGTVLKKANGSHKKIDIINIQDSDDSDSKDLVNGSLPPLDLKAKLRALRTHSKSPPTLTSLSSRMLAPPPPPNIRKHKSSHHSSRHKHKRKKSSHSRSASTSDDSDRSRHDSDHSPSKRSKSSRKKVSRRDETHSAKRSSSHRDRKETKKKKEKRDDHESPSSKKSKSRHKTKSHKRRRSRSESESPKKSHSKSKTKRRKSEDSSDDSESSD